MSLRIRKALPFLLAVTLPAIAQPDERFVAQTFSKAAVYVLNTDYLYGPVAETFTAAELDVLESHSDALSDMVGGAFRGAHSVGAASFIGHFRMEQHIALLRWQLFSPGMPYGWEGPDYDSEEDYLSDNQFVYHSVYLRAIEEAAQAPIYQVIQPTQREIEELLRYSDNSSMPYYYWAKWLMRELRITEQSR